MSKETGRKRKAKEETPTKPPTSPLPTPEIKTEVLPPPEEKPWVKCLSCFDKDAKLKLSTNCLHVDGEKGYRMIRGTTGVAEGDCYYEVTINDPIVIGPKFPEAHTRLGWSTEKGNVEAPVGFDKYSYSYRDVKGTKFHQSIGATYGEPYGPKDVIGCFIRLRDDQPESDLKLTPQQIQFREQAKQAAMLPLSGSKIVFFKNGVSQGVAFTDIFKGTYFPAIALYMGASVTVNFGPDFKYPPSSVLSDDLGTMEWGAEVHNPNHLQEEKNRLASAKPPKPEPTAPSSPKKSRRKKTAANADTAHQTPNATSSDAPIKSEASTGNNNDTNTPTSDHSDHAASSDHGDHAASSDNSEHAASSEANHEAADNHDTTSTTATTHETNTEDNTANPITTTTDNADDETPNSDNTTNEASANDDSVNDDTAKRETAAIDDDDDTTMADNVVVGDTPEVLKEETMGESPVKTEE